MKRILAWALIMVLLLSCSAVATEIRSDEYSDAPANPTQDNIIQITARVYPKDEKSAPFSLVQMLPTALTVDSLAPIYDFVEIDKNPPARYFPEHVQQEIIEIGFDPDVLFMPEFMSVLPQVYPYALKKEADVKVEALFDIEYYVGRPVVVVLGWDGDEGVEWKALPASVPEQDCIHFTIPYEILKIINGQETLFSVLTIRPGVGYSNGVYEEIKIPHIIPSITAGDITFIEDSYISESGGEPAPCDIVLTEKNRRIALEIDAIDRHINEDEKPVMQYYKTEMNRQTDLLLPQEVQNDELVAYEIACVKALEYIEPYGDVMTRFTFATPYYEGQPMVSLLALPDEEDEDEEMIWSALHTEVKRVYINETEYIDYVEITFGSAVVTRMMEETALLLVLSTPMPE